MKTALYWFRYDLRLADNPGWTQLVANNDSLVGVYVLPQHWLLQGRYQCKGIDRHRLVFLFESLRDLRAQLRGVGSDLVVLQGDPVNQVVNLAQQLDVSAVGVGDHPGSDEADQVAKLKAQLDVPLYLTENFTLFDRTELPFALADLPDVFSQFRKQIEKRTPTRALPIAPPLRARVPVSDVRCELDSLCARFTRSDAEALPSNRVHFSGGTRAGMQQLDYFLFESHLIANYKQTRDQLDGWDFSSKLSPWLAFGCVSARQVVEAIRRYESTHQANESTYWLYFEILWREYFQWLAYRVGKKLFALRGIQNKNPLLSFYPSEFMAWCYGNTASDFVNAFMRQLLYTGWMSNRGRQIVASYLINELGVDWRYGAAWFEQQLIDYDVAANWGNWQYLAGVGTDPRGRRHFNIDKQQQTHDPDFSFTQHWD